MFFLTLFFLANTASAQIFTYNDTLKVDSLLQLAEKQTANACESPIIGVLVQDYFFSGAFL